MKKRNAYIIIGAAALAAVTIIVGIFSDGFKRFGRPKDEINIPSIEDPASMLLYGVSEAPYKAGDLIFRCNSEAVFRYLACGENGEIPEIKKGYNASSWREIKDGDTISDTDCRNIMLVTTDQHGYVTSSKFYPYVPGIIYGESNPDQYDDGVFYNEEDPTLEEDRAVRLASNLFRSARTSYYGSSYGYIIQGYLTTYSYGLLEGYLHTGVDFTTRDGRPFYSPISGKIVYAGDKDDYHTIIIYDEFNDLSLLILHGQDVSPAQSIFENGGEVKHGDLLGYGGSAGEPDGDTQLHLELQGGKAAKYQSFSKKQEYSRINNYDPLIIADLYGLTQKEESTYDSFTELGTNAFNAQNSGCVVTVGNWIYYIDSVNNTICSSRPDGTKRTVLARCKAKNLNYSDGWLYYSNLDESGHLMKTACDGSASAKVVEANASKFIIAANNWLFYANEAENGTLYKVRTDGTEKTLLRKGDIENPFYYDGWIFYTMGAKTKKERIRRFNTETGEDVQLISVRSDRPFIYDLQLCYRVYYPDKNCFATSLAEINEAAAQPIIPAAYYNVYAGRGYIVFSNVNDGSALYITFPGRDGVYKLTGDTLCSDITYSGGWLYYHTNIDGSGTDLCRINIQSLKKQMLDPATGLWRDVAIDCDENVPRLVKDNRAHTVTEPDTTPAPPSEDPSGNRDNVKPITPPPEVTPEVTPDETPDGTPDTTPDETPDSTPDITPEPEETPTDPTSEPEPTPEPGETDEPPTATTPAPEVTDPAPEVTDGE